MVGWYWSFRRGGVDEKFASKRACALGVSLPLLWSATFRRRTDIKYSAYLLLLCAKSFDFVCQSRLPAGASGSGKTSSAHQITTESALVSARSSPASRIEAPPSGNAVEIVDQVAGRGNCRQYGRRHRGRRSHMKKAAGGRNSGFGSERGENRVLHPDSIVCNGEVDDAVED